MTDGIYPAPTQDLSRMRSEASAPDTDAAFRAFSKQVFAEGALSAKTKTFYRGGGRARHAVPVLHSRPYESRATCRRDAAGADGCDPGGRGDARRRCFAHATIALAEIEAEQPPHEHG